MEFWVFPQCIPGVCLVQHIKGGPIYNHMQPNYCGMKLVCFVVCSEGSEMAHQRSTMCTQRPSNLNFEGRARRTGLDRPRGPQATGFATR